MIELGKKVRDKVTGFEGITTGYCTYLYGCNQHNIVPLVQDGKCGNAEWFDEGRIEVIGPGITKEEVAGEKPGGPQRDAPPA